MNIRRYRDMSGDWLSQSRDGNSGQVATDTNGSVSKLIASLQDSDENVRLNAAYALGGIGESVVTGTHAIFTG